MRPKYHVMTGLQMNEGIILETEIMKVNKKGGGVEVRSLRRMGQSRGTEGLRRS